MVNEEILRLIDKTPEDGQLRLDLSDKNIGYLPKRIGELQNLTWLDLSNNGLSSLPSEIFQLKNLGWLYLGNNNLTRLPQDIKNLQRLSLLSLSGNHLKSLPLEIGQLQNLTELDLSDNKFMSLPSGILKLRSLTWLNLSGNRLRNIPIDIAQIKNLTSLDLKGNKLIDLAPEIVQLQSLIELDLTDNPLSSPVNIVTKSQRPDNTSNRHEKLQDQEQDQEDHVYESKLIILSEGRATETALLEKEIHDEDCQLRHYEESTVDIDISQWPLQKDNRKFQADIWNFGGQEISHSTHQLFLTELSKSGKGIKQALEQEPKNYLTQDEYFDICQHYGLTEKEDKLKLSRHLHRLGICLHFQNDPLLRKIIILNPNWCADAVYKVLNNVRIKQSEGKFSKTDLDTIWHEGKYAKVQDELLQMMLEVKLCYSIPSQKNTYIIPQLLPSEPPEYEWDESNNLSLLCVYKFMPKGILTRLIVEIPSYIDKINVWRSGVTVHLEETFAEVIENYRPYEGEIKIRVAGKSKKNLLSIIVHELNRIHDSYEDLKVKKLVPCNCSICQAIKTTHLYDFEFLRRFLDN